MIAGIMLIWSTFICSPMAIKIYKLFFDIPCLDVYQVAASVNISISIWKRNDIVLGQQNLCFPFECHNCQECIFSSCWTIARWFWANFYLSWQKGHKSSVSSVLAASVLEKWVASQLLCSWVVVSLIVYEETHTLLKLIFYYYTAQLIAAGKTASWDMTGAQKAWGAEITKAHNTYRGAENKGIPSLVREWLNP